MRQLLRTTSVWAFAALFGCISLLGPGWHCVFGHHFHGPAACDHGHCHTHLPELAPVQTTANDELSGGTIASLPGAGHDCPLCQFFGAAQWAETIPPAERGQLAREFASPAQQSLRLTFVSLYQSRGPPPCASRV